MEHIIITLLIGLITGMNTFLFGGLAIKSKALKEKSESKLAKFVRETKESTFSLIAGLSFFIPVLYATSSQPKYPALISGSITWCIVAILSGVYWYKNTLQFFKITMKKSTNKRSTDLTRHQATPKQDISK